MRIQKINNQHRRDFYADMICEHCGYIKKNVSGYDDDNYHRNVIPNMICPKCGKKASEDYRPLSTKYAEGDTV